MPDSERINFLLRMKAEILEPSQSWDFFQTMRRSPLVLIEMPLEFRIQRILQEYVTDMLTGFQMKHSEQGFEYFSAYLYNSLLRIQKRLGLERYKYLHDSWHSSKNPIKHRNIHRSRGLDNCFTCRVLWSDVCVSDKENKESVIFQRKL